MGYTHPAEKSHLENIFVFGSCECALSVVILLIKYDLLHYSFAAADDIWEVVRVVLANILYFLDRIAVVEEID